MWCYVAGEMSTWRTLTLAAESNLIISVVLSFRLTWLCINYVLKSSWPPWISKNHNWKRTKGISDVSRTVKCSTFLHWRLYEKINKGLRYCCKCKKNTLEISAQNNCVITDHTLPLCVLNFQNWMSVNFG